MQNEMEGQLKFAMQIPTWKLIMNHRSMTMEILFDVIQEENQLLIDIIFQRRLATMNDYDRSPPSPGNKFEIEDE